MTKDLYLATCCVGSVEEVLAPLHEGSLLLVLRREYGIALFERGLLCIYFSLRLSRASALAVG